ncbi:unnamed protein product [Caenorhabditis sp. 36 PRJEB53466]|nr:unnamed protein product [Caenorhabditis sp. 36 PRJEB53466]
MFSMERNRRTTNIVPGRRMITDKVAYHNAGIAEDRSYMTEDTFIKHASMNSTRDDDERNWKKEGLSDNEILSRQEARAYKKHSDAGARLEREKFGAKNFDELMNLSEYSERESDDENEEKNEKTTEKSQKKTNAFAIPSLPKHLSEKSMLSSPNTATKGSGKAGLSCSTPVGGKDVSMRSLRTLDISLVVNTDKLDSRRVTVHNKQVIIPPLIEQDTESSAQKTHTIDKSRDSDLQGAFTVPQDSLQKTFTKTDSLQGTFVKETERASMAHLTFSESPQRIPVKEVEAAQDAESIQGTFTKEAREEETESLQGAFVKPSDAAGGDNNESMHGTLVLTDKDITSSPTPQNNSALRETVNEKVPIIENTIEGGDKKRSKKLMESMMIDMPSPGAINFKTSRKKMRPTLATPPRSKIASRLSTDSDKEKTIEMLSIAEEATVGVESNGNSYVDPVSVNGSHISPIPEKDESIAMDTTLQFTPKSSRRNISIREMESVERVRALMKSSGRISALPATLHTSASTSKSNHNYAKPTISSLAKNMNIEECNELLKTEKLNRITTPTHAPVKTPSTRRQVEHEEDEEEEKEKEDEVMKTMEERTRTPALRDETEKVDEESNSRSMSNVEDAMNTLSVRDQHRMLEDFDYGYDDQQQEDLDREDSDDSLPAPKQIRRPKRGVALLSDSISSVNTPGIERRSNRYRTVNNNTVVSDSWVSQHDDPPRGRRQRTQQMGMQLAKRQIIEPERAPDGLRRSTRTRMKPVRSWLGEQAIYVQSPSGGKRLKGVNDVIIKDKRLCKFRTADVIMATEREQRMKAAKKARAAERRRRLALDQSMGRRLNESQDEIVTSDDDE